LNKHFCLVPKALIPGGKGNIFHGITAGVSLLLPMPLVEQEDAHNFRRMELGL